jgi:hypothetical protein
VDQKLKCQRMPFIIQDMYFISIKQIAFTKWSAFELQIFLDLPIEVDPKDASTLSSSFLVEVTGGVHTSTSISFQALSLVYYEPLKAQGYFSGKMIKTPS